MQALETLVVASIVTVSILYSACRLTSARFHLRVIDFLGKVFGNAPDGWIARLRGRTLARLSGGCGACASNVKLAVHGPSSNPSQAHRPP